MPFLRDSLDVAFVLITQLCVLSLIVIYSVMIPGTPEAPRKVVVAFCPTVELPPGMSLKGAAVSFMNYDFPVVDSEVRKAFDSLAYQIGVMPSLPLFGGKVEVCLRPESLDKIERIAWVS